MVTLEEFNMEKFSSQWEYNPDDWKGDVNELASETVPNDALSVSDILLRFSRGTLPNISFPTYYDGEDPDFDEADPTLSPDFDLSDTDAIQERIAYLQRILNESSVQDTGNAVLDETSAAPPEGV